MRTAARPAIWAAVGNLAARESGQYNDLKFSDALQTIWRLISHVDAYLVQRKPWVLAKDPDQRQELADVLYDACEALRVILVLVHPVMPKATTQIWMQIGQNTHLGEQQIDSLDWGQLAAGTALGRVAGVFPRLETATALARLDELAETDRKSGTPAAEALREAPLQVPVQLELAQSGGEPEKSKEAFISVQTENKPEAAPQSSPESKAPSPQPPVPSPQPPAPSLISIGDFAKVEMRVGEVKAAEHVPGASKLLKLMVDIGTEVRQVVAGLAEYYRPENLIGMKVVVVTNLQPRKLRGVESNGMIVAASAEDHGRPVLVTFKEDVENGARLK